MRSMAWFVLALLVALPAAAETPPASVPRAVEKHYNTLRSLQAQFEESVSTAAARAPRRQERGTVYLLRPRKMRWEYSDPPGKLFVSDANMFYLYSPNSNQVQKIPLKQAEDLRAPLAFLLGKLDFQKEFGKIVVQNAPEGILLTADARGEQDPYTQVVFTIDPRTFEIHRIVVNGQDGLITQFVFSGETDNPPLEAALFRFQAPPGVEVVETAR